MGDYDLTIDNLNVDGATEEELESLVIAHNTLAALLAPHSQEGQEMLGYIDSHMVGSRFFDQGKSGTFRTSVASFYEVSAEEVEALPEKMTLKEMREHEGLKDQNARLDDLFDNHMRPYIDATNPIIVAALPNQYKD